jgi:adenylate cyclase
MRERTRELLQSWRDALAETGNAEAAVNLVACLGVHTGPVVAGNLGGRRRLKYGIIGDTVNVAARVQSLAARLGEGILITREVAERLPPALRDTASSRGEHVVKGRSQPVEVLAL